MRPFKYLPLLAALALAAGCGDADRHSQEAGQSEPDSPTLASVNGEPVTENLLNAYLRARGTSDPSQEQRESALQEVVNLVLLRQQAEKQDLDEKPEVKADLALHRISTLATRQVRSHNADNPITEADARMEYDRNRDTAGTKEYHVRHILLSSREAAEQVIADLNEGADFEDLADERSLDTREEAGGDLGWINLTQLPEALRDPVRNLRAAAHSQEPIQTRYGWHVLKLDETRQLEPPGFEEVKQGVITSLQRQRMESYVQELRGEADIKVAEQFVESPAQPTNPTAAPAARPEGDGNQSVQPPDESESDN